MRARTSIAASPERNVNLERIQSVIALLAAGGLLVLTISSVVRTSSQSQLSYAMTMIVAWVAVLASALLGRQRSTPGPQAQGAPAPAIAPAFAAGETPGTAPVPQTSSTPPPPADGTEVL